MTLRHMLSCRHLLAAFCLFLLARLHAPAGEEKPVFKFKGEAPELVNRWFEEGTAEGNGGDWYDNRDGNHSPLGIGQYPQLQKVQYSEEERKRRLHWAAAARVLPHITVGNSSTSAGPTQTGSNPRKYYTHPMGMALLYKQYRGNNLYIYPEHRDHDAGHNGNGGYGDLYPLNSPCLIISQGSSGSDKVFMRAAFLTLAAFRPEVKKKLAASGMLMPTLQYIFRRCNKQVESDADYLTGKAHPTVFNGGRVNDVAMVEMAHEMTLETLPPLVEIRIAQEQKAVPGQDYFEIGFSEVLCQTPAVIGRIHRRLDRDYTLLVEAKGGDLNDRALSYEWVLLRGDPERVSIIPSKDGTTARIVVPYHHRRPIALDARMDSNRVDIGVFVNNGVHYSPPAFVTVYTLDTQLRSYTADGRPLDIHYAAGSTELHGFDDQSLLGGDCPVRDWNAFFVVLSEEDESLGGKLLEARFSPGELAFLRAQAAPFAEELEAHNLRNQELQTALKSTRETHQTARGTAQELQKKLQNAKKQEKPQDELDGLQQELDAARKKEHETRKPIRDTERAIKDSRAKPLGILTRAGQDVGASVRDLARRALIAMKNDPALYVANQNAFAESAKWARKDLDRLHKREILIDAGGKLALNPLHRGDASPAERMSRYQQYELTRFNLALMQRTLFSFFRFQATATNYVDQRLGFPCDCRDAYRYADDGRLLGWRRWQDNDVHDFTAAGLLVLEKDGQGRPEKACEVDYLLAMRYRDRKQKNKLVGRILFDGANCTVYLDKEKKLVDRHGKGRGVKPQHVQFLRLKGHDGYVVDINHFDAQNRQTGWNRFQNGKVFEFTRVGPNKFVAKDAAGKVAPEGEVAYQVGLGDASWLFEPTAKAFRFDYAGPDDLLGTREPAPADK